MYSIDTLSGLRHVISPTCFSRSGWLSGSLCSGKAVRLQVRERMVFPDNGLPEQMLTIRT